ncbi:MAG TPA: TlpA disulfide reductase family protein [Solirubrobacteraceae bacterium]|nr:TlpA disulfide reductase family protein [Solirubrobacteraceae bacterium]
MVGAFAAVLVAIFAIYSFTAHAPSSAGVAVGRQLHFFSAPLAASTLNGDANLNPPCTLAHHDRRALNVCLLVKRGPLVLDFFVTDSTACEREVSTLQSLAEEPSLRGVQFAAVAINASHAATARAVRKHGWTIPVAYDADGGVGALYGVTACPMLELSERGGRVADRLIGEHWLNENALEARVRPLIGAGVSG